jgi:hypothetical protein
MALLNQARFRFMKDLGAPALMGLAGLRKRRRPAQAGPLFGPPLRCSGRLKEIMTRHYYLSRYAEGAAPVAWVTSGAPVEMLRPFDFYTVYPENHGALCGAQKAGPELAPLQRRGAITRICALMHALIWACVSRERRRWAGCPDRTFFLRPTTSARP